MGGETKTNAATPKGAPKAAPPPPKLDFSKIPEPVRASKVAKSANDRLWKDIPKPGEQRNDENKKDLVPYGLIVRSDDDMLAKRDDFLLLPASFLHASMKTANAVFRIINSKIGMAHILSAKQPLYKKKKNKDKYTRMSLAVCHGTDAATRERFPYDHSAKSALQTTHGQGCRVAEAKDVMCMTAGKRDAENEENDVDNAEVCLMDERCRCNDLSSFYKKEWDRKKKKFVKTPVDYSDFYINFVRKRNGGKRLPTPAAKHSCWYENDRLDEVVAASNSMYIRKFGWTSNHASRNYPGWTECLLADAKPKESTSIDALIIELPPQIGKQERLVEYKTHLLGIMEEGSVQNRLLENYERHGHMPVLVLEEAVGMSQEECDRMWAGIHCNISFRKQFWAQPLNFTDGSCLAKPDGCDDVYYFPPKNYRKYDRRKKERAPPASTLVCDITVPPQCRKKSMPSNDEVEKAEADGFDTNVTKEVANKVVVEVEKVVTKVDKNGTGVDKVVAEVDKNAAVGADNVVANNSRDQKRDGTENGDSDQTSSAKADDSNNVQKFEPSAVQQSVTTPPWKTNSTSNHPVDKSSSSSSSSSQPIPSRSDLTTTLTSPHLVVHSKLNITKHSLSSTNPIRNNYNNSNNAGSAFDCVLPYQEAVVGIGFLLVVIWAYLLRSDRRSRAYN